MKISFFSPVFRHYQIAVTDIVTLGKKIDVRPSSFFSNLASLKRSGSQLWNKMGVFWMGCTFNEDSLATAN